MDQLGVIAAFATFGATVVLAVITFFYFREVRRQVRAQTSPCVILYASLDESRRTIIQLVVKNIGTAMAYDVRFQFSDPLPNRAWGMDVVGAETAQPMRSGPLIDGIPTLAPGETRVIDWGQYAGLRKNLGEKHAEATCSFTDGKVAMPSTRAVVEVDSFETNVAVESEGSRIVRQLEKIARGVERLEPRLPIQVQVVPTPTEEPLA